MAQEFKKWFPLAVKATSLTPRFRVLCFHNAGGESLLFVSKGNPRNPMPNPLVDFCKENDGEVLPVHLPGRTLRQKEECWTSAFAVGEKIVELLSESGRIVTGAKCSPCEDVPIFVVAYSMGCLCAYEFLKCMKKKGFRPQVKMAFFTSMVSPNTPKHLRPWKQSAHLSTLELQDECRAWAANSELFQADVWQMYEKVIRGDFKVFDEYEDTDSLENDAHDQNRNSNSESNVKILPLKIPTVIFTATKDERATPQRVDGWADLMCGPTISRIMQTIEGDHGFIYSGSARQVWMKHIVDHVDRVLLDMEYQ